MDDIRRKTEKDICKLKVELKNHFESISDYRKALLLHLIHEKQKYLIHFNITITRKDAPSP